MTSTVYSYNTTGQGPRPITYVTLGRALPCRTAAGYGLGETESLLLTKPLPLTNPKTPNPCAMQDRFMRSVYRRQPQVFLYSPDAFQATLDAISDLTGLPPHQARPPPPTPPPPHPKKRAQGSL
jgi:hypothetical protein